MKFIIRFKNNYKFLALFLLFIINIISCDRYRHLTNTDYVHKLQATYINDEGCRHKGILKKSDNPNMDLLNATFNNDIKAIKDALKNGANIDARITEKRDAVKGCYVGRTALMIAADNGYADIVRFLINNGVNVNAKVINVVPWAKGSNETALHCAARGGYQEIVKLLLANNAEVNSKDIDCITPIYLAAGKGHKEIVELLIAKGADINVARCSHPWHIDQHAYSETPLLQALRSCHKKIAELLIIKGADIKAMGFGGQTPLHRAAGCGFKELVELLIAKGVDVNIRSGGSGASSPTRGGYYTPLHNAADNGHKEIVELLITNGADVNAMDCNYRTPLDWIAYNDYQEIVKLLIANGAKTNIKDRYGKEAIESPSSSKLITGLEPQDSPKSFTGEEKGSITTIKKVKEKPDVIPPKTVPENTKPVKVTCNKLWEEAKIDKTIKGYQKYLDQCPNDTHGDLAKAEIKKIEKAMEEDKAWKTAKKKNTIKDYSAFAKKYPASKYLNTALRCTRSYYWQDQVNNNNSLHNYIQLGLAYSREWNYEKAKAIFEEKKKFAPQNTEILLALGKIYYFLNKSKIGLKYLEKALSLNPIFSEAWFYTGKCHEKDSNNSEAINCYNQAIKLNPSYTEAYFQRAMIHRLLLNFKAATKDFQKVIELNDNKRLINLSKKIIYQIK